MAIIPNPIDNIVISPEDLHINTSAIIKLKKALGKKIVGTTEYVFLGMYLDSPKNLIITNDITNRAKASRNHIFIFIANTATPPEIMTAIHVAQTKLFAFSKLNFSMTTHFSLTFYFNMNIHNYVLMSTFLNYT